VVASPDMLDEYRHVLAYPEVAALIYPDLLRAFTSHWLDDIELVEPPETPHVCRDPDDDKVVAAAVYGLADYILTVDEDLLAPEVKEVLEEMGITVTSGANLLRILDSRSEP
jgi:uncharacterized protein